MIRPHPSLPHVAFGNGMNAHETSGMQICITTELDDDHLMTDAGTSTFVVTMRAFQLALLPIVP